MTRASSIILAPLGVLYGAITATRLSLYQRGLLRTLKLDAPVISVGNVTTGGTGKTPLVEYIARTLAANGRKVCILTRGYGRENPKARVLVSDWQHVLATEAEAGDEPGLLAETLSGIASVISDRDRFAAGKWAISELGADVLILDDGLQHLRLARDLNVATVDATNPWGGGRLLPSGRLREARAGLARADCIVLTRADQCGDLKSLEREIDEASSKRPVFTSRMRVRRLRRLDGELPTSDSPLKPTIEMPFAPFCAIGNPRSFIKQLEDEGYDLTEPSIFSDHYRYDQRDLDGIVAKALSAGATRLITTAKDAVKLRDLTVELPCFVLEIEICIDDESRFVEMIKAVESRKSCD